MSDEMKKLLSLALTLCLALSLCVPAMAAGSGMNNFTKKAVYQNQFSDVAATYWAASMVKTCYEYGLMQGTEPKSFSPKGDLTVAQAIVMADRIHEIYTTGRSTLENGTPWYQTYVDYALENGIIAKGDFTDYTAKATRAQMAYIFCNALPESTLSAINADQTIPDVNASTPYATSIQTLYRAGVLTGSDIYGSFNPGKNIIRAEAATILARMAIPAHRQHVVLMKQVSWKGGVTLAVPQTAQEDNSSGVYSLISERDQAGAIVNMDQNEAYRGLNIAVLTPAEMNDTLTESFAVSDMTLTGAKSVLVKFGAIQAYRTTGTLTGENGSSKCAIFTYIAGDSMYMVALISYTSDQVLQDMANGLQVSGCNATPKM